MTSVTLQICLRIRSVFSHYVFILLLSLKQTGGNCNSRYTCQKFPKCCWVFSRLGRLYLWNNFCKVLLWNNCSSRHKHTHTYFIQSTTESMTANTFSFSLLGREEKRRGHHLSSYDHGPPTTNMVSQGDHTHTQALQKQAVLYITWHKHI